MKTRSRFGSVGLLVAAMLTGCASVPPAQAARDLKSIVGKWEGSLVNARGQAIYPATLTIREDGTYENVVPSMSKPGPEFVGTVGVVDGQFRWKERTTGQTGVWTLHEGDGKRVLISDGGGTIGTAEYRPAR